MNVVTEVGREGVQRGIFNSYYNTNTNFLANVSRLIFSDKIFAMVILAANLVGLLEFILTCFAHAIYIALIHLDPIIYFTHFDC